MSLAASAAADLPLEPTKVLRRKAVRKRTSISEGF